MKYRELSQNEIEAYNIGYKNGSRQAVIKVLEFESPEEKKIYRQGYNAGCQDRKRHNVSTKEFVSNVSNVSNVDSYDSAIAITNTVTNTGGISNKGVIGGKEKKGVFVAPTLEEVLTYAKQMNDIAGMGGFVCGKQTAIDFFNQYDRQGWLLGNGIHMTNWKSGLRRWADEQKKKLLDE